MKYNLDALSPRQFEQLTQALMLKSLGPAVSVFGDGPDGGREATWEGRVPALRGSEEWDGYGVLQAKMHLHPGEVAANLKWLNGQLKDELASWAATESKRERKPDYIVFASNVRLSAAAGGGKDSILESIATYISANSLPIRDFRVLDYDDLCAHLDDAPGIRQSYAALITPGDIIAEIWEQQQSARDDFSDALRAHAARSLRDDTYLNLSQTGTVRDQQVTVAEVFVDLPLEQKVHSFELRAEARRPIGRRRRNNVVQTLVESFDAASGISEERLESLKQVVIIGGPGQGKSTATQFLAQMYRARFIEGSPLEQDAELAPSLRSIEERLAVLRVDQPRARRWPIRILLTDLADSLAAGDGAISLLEYIAQAVSHRSSVTVSATQMRGWLKSYPWLLIVDGLDEVPNTSNRRDVISCIKDFFHDVKLVEADVAIVATTRPQGYSDEFNPDHFSHLNLASLPLSVALSYAQGFISVRAGEGTSASGKIYDRLVRASKDETTARLFSSPLQVTILTVLIEKLGRVPQDRWRLFSQYYKVISQRELEKGGELSDLLQMYESDVDYLHRFIGNLLQGRAAEAGETSSTLSREEFNLIISTRLTDQGHSTAEVERLSAEFLRLVTHRLVFLALLQADRVGFEIRSLQEYMAGWHIVSRPEREVVPAIREKAVDPYWRNVVLFAIGCIFADRDHLKAEILNLCTEIDMKNSKTQMVKPGSLLALDILLDGSCHAQPAYSRPLGDRSSKLLEGPIQSRVKDFAKFRDSELADIYRAEVCKVTPAPALTWANRGIALDAMCASDLSNEEQIRALFANASNEGRRALVEVIGSGQYRYLSAGATEYIGDFSPSLLIGELAQMGIRHIPTGDESYPAWLSSLGRLIPSFMDGMTFSAHSETESVSFSLCSLEGNHEVWKHLSRLSFQHPGWIMLRAIGEFVLEPTKERLAETLEAVAGADFADRELTRYAPWVLAACYEAASKYTSYYSGLSVEEVLSRFAQASREGLLGDEKDWLSAERRWANATEPTGASDLLSSEDVCGSIHIPIYPGLADAGALLFGSSMGYAHAEDDKLAAQIEEMLTYARAIAEVKCDLHRACLAHSVSFMASVGLREADPENAIYARSLRELFEILVNTTSILADGSPLWIGWIVAAPEDWRNDGSSISLFDQLSRLTIDGPLFEVSGTDYSWISSLAASDDSRWVKYLLLTHANPEFLTSVSHDELARLVPGETVSPQARLLSQVCTLLTSTVEDIASGNLDEVLRCVASRSEVRSFVNLRLFETWVEQTTREKRDAIFLRASMILSELAPFESSQFSERLR